MQVRLFVAPVGMVIVLACTSPASHAVEPGSYWSKVQGVALWELGNSPSAYIWDEKDPFIKYCDGKNKVYIYELGSKGYICETLKKEVGDLGYSIYVMGLTEKTDRIYTVSKHRIETKHWKFESVGNVEAATAREIAKQYSGKIRREGTSNNKSALGSYNKYETKLSVGVKEVLIVPTEYFYWQSGDEDLVSSVVVMESGSHRFIGHISGCLERLVDIDGDGVPEVKTKTCVPAESIHVDYWKIYPEVKPLVRFTQ